MQLIRLELKNFKGINRFTFEPNGQSASIYGANETGKTTIYDALTWLLTDKDSRDRSPDSFGIKTRDKNGDVIHGVDHEVKGEFDCITLRKVYKEKWTRKRGSSKEEFSGHTTDYYVDGVPVKMSEYQEAVEDIISEDLLKMLTMPDYFPAQLHWSDRRKVLFELAGEINVEDIIASYGDLERYPEVVNGRSHEDQEKVLKSRKRELNKELDNIPSRIDELAGLIENVDDVDEARETVEDLKGKKETIEAKRSEVKSGGRIADLKVKRQELQAKYKELENKHRETVQESLSEQRGKVSDLEDKVDEAESDWRDAKRDYEKAESAVKQLESVKDNVQSEIEEIQAREPKAASAFEPDQCPVCDRPMPDAEEHDYEQYLDEVKQQKAEELKETKKELEQVEADLVEAKEAEQIAGSNAANMKGKLSQRKEALRKARLNLKEQKADQPEFSNEEIDRQIEDIDQKIANHRQEKQSQLEKLNDLIEDLDRKIEAAQSKIHKAKENQKYNKRIAELQAQRKEVAEELDQVEADLHIMEEFVRARSAYVTDKVNEKFEHVSWKLFEEQINGGISETCTAVYKGVPFDEGLNNAGRIQAGIDIINTLSEHYGKSAPVFVDNREGVTELPKNDLQVISLIVSPEHTELTVEPERKLAKV